MFRKTPKRAAKIQIKQKRKEITERVREVDKHLVEKNVEMIFAFGRRISTFHPKMKQNVETQFPNFDVSSQNGVKCRMLAKCVRSPVYKTADSAIDRKT